MPNTQPEGVTPPDTRLEGENPPDTKLEGEIPPDSKLEGETLHDSKFEGKTPPENMENKMETKGTQIAEGAPNPKEAAPSDTRPCTGGTKAEADQEVPC